MSIRRAPARSAMPTPSPALLLGAVVRRNIFIMPPEQRITAVAADGDRRVRSARRTYGAGDLAVTGHDVGEADIVDHADGGVAAGLVAQRRADRRAGAQKIHIDAALAAAAGRLDLVDPAVVAGAPS